MPIAHPRKQMDSELLVIPLTHEAVAGAVDHLGRPASRSNTGGWKSAFFLIGGEIAERITFHGIWLNLISYLTGPLCQSTASAAAAVNAWFGTSFMLPLAAAFVADSYFGRYRTTLLASLLYVLSVGLLALSSLLFSDPHPKDGDTCRASSLHLTFFYLSLYLMAFAQGAYKPCVQAFGADQFDPDDPTECISRSSFFNWWYFGSCGSTIVSAVVVSYIQDNFGWGLGFGILCIFMSFALALFLFGTKTYRFYPVDENISSLVQTAKSLVPWARNKKKRVQNSSAEDGAVRLWDNSLSGVSSCAEDANGNSTELTEGIRRLFPICATCLVYGIAIAQTSTWFNKQGSTLDRRIGSNINVQVPPAALYCFISATVLVLMPIYDHILVPFARSFSKLPSGITMLQRVGTGLFFSLLSMVAAALVEMKRLEVAKDSGMVDQHDSTIPMSIWWLVPQYTLVGISQLLAFVGLQEFLYDQVPDALRSLGLAMYLSIFGLGNFLSNILISLIEQVTTRSGENWFPNNLNRGHLDYFYWLLAGLSALAFLLFLHFARAYDTSRSGTDMHEVNH